MPPSTRDEIQRYCSSIITHAEHCGSSAYEIELAFKQADNILGTKYKEQKSLCTDMQAMAHALIEAAKLLRSM